MALNDYWEGRGESYYGRISIAYVVRNRVASVRTSSICDVIYKDKQFSWVYKHLNEVPQDKVQWANSLKVAGAMLDPEQTIVDPTHGSLWYHEKGMKPKWANRLYAWIDIGNHRFYLEKGRETANE